MTRKHSERQSSRYLGQILGMTVVARWKHNWKTRKSSPGSWIPCCSKKHPRNNRNFWDQIWPLHVEQWVSALSQRRNLRSKDTRRFYSSSTKQFPQPYSHTPWCKQKLENFHNVTYICFRLYKTGLIFSII